MTGWVADGAGVAFSSTPDCIIYIVKNYVSNSQIGSV